MQHYTSFLHKIRANNLLHDPQIRNKINELKSKNLIYYHSLKTPSIRTNIIQHTFLHKIRTDNLLHDLQT